MLAGMQDDAPQHDEHLKEFFLDLARPKENTDEARAAARERWNAWRNAPANEDVSVTFAGVDFTRPENSAISFDGFAFGDLARFDGARFGDRARFDGARFGHVARFDGARFGDDARFDGATFDGLARFDGARFGVWALFDGATFGGWAFFDGATFGRVARFDGATFGDWASFRAAVLGEDASFAAAPVGPWKERERARRFGPEGERDDEARRADTAWCARQEAGNLGPQSFQRLDLSGARILGSISFVRRSFEQPADFTGATFHAPPDFDGATNLQRIDLTGARIGFAPPDQAWWRRHWTEDSAVPVRLRAFRAVAEQTKNHDLERDLYIEERKAERGVVRARLCEAFRAERNGVRQLARIGPLIVAWLWRRVMDVYWLLSDYGRSLARPLVWLLLTLWPFMWTFDASLADQRRAATRAAFAAAAGSKADAAAATKRTYYAATRQLAISNTIPFVGPLTIDGEVKKFLLCGAPVADEKAQKACVPIAPRGYQLTLIGQNVLSALLLFFFGLALRNYFKVK